MIKKQFYFLLLAAFSLFVVSCGQNESESEKTKADSVAHQPALKTDKSSGKPSNISILDSIGMEGLTKNIPAPVGYANDFEKIFTKNQVRSLDSLAKSIEKESTIEVSIVTLDSSMTSKKDFGNTILALANKWGVGKKEKNNGILIGISKELKTIWIRSGTGIEKKLTNQKTTEIIKTVILPYFRQNDFYEGTKQGVIALYQQSK